MKDHNLAITNQILTMITKNGELPWNRPWNMVKGLSATNFNSGRIYSGYFNQMVLQFAANGKLPLFAPFSKDHPAMKGEKATFIWRPLISKKVDEKTHEEKSRLVGFTTIPVFHYTQCQGIDIEALEEKYAPKSPEAIEFNPIQNCESVLKNMPNCPKISNDGGNSAFYHPASDSIHMPQQTQFISSADYYKTLFHELTHSTGHFTRLDRFKKTGNEFKNHHKDYSFEELVAELGACFISSACGISPSQNIENSVAYIQNWIKSLQSNPDWIIKASSFATKATHFILNDNPNKEETNEVTPA